MRIAHYAADLWADGGIATYVERLTSAQRQSGHDVVWLCQAPPQGTPLRDHMHVVTDDTLYHTAATLNLDVLHAHRTLPMPLPTQPPFTVVRTMHGHQGGCPSGTRYLRRSQQPCDRTYHPFHCARMHVQERCGSCRPKRMWQNFQRLQTERAQTERVPTATVSRYVHEMMVRAGCEPENMVVCPSPAPAVQPFIAPPSTHAWLLYAGRLAPEKGLSWLLDAMVHIDSSVVLHVAGSGTEAHTNAIYRHVERLNLTERVRFHGWCEPSALTALMTIAWIVVVPSVWNEPAGLVPLDAAAHARFVVASNGGGLPEYVAPDASTLVPPNDTEALATALSHHLATYPLLVEAGRRAQHHAAVTYSALHTARAYDRLYAEAATRRHALLA